MSKTVQVDSIILQLFDTKVHIDIYFVCLEQTQNLPRGSSRYRIFQTLSQPIANALIPKRSFAIAQQENVICPYVSFPGPSFSRQKKTRLVCTHIPCCCSPYSFPWCSNTISSTRHWTNFNVFYMESRVIWNTKPFTSIASVKNTSGGILFSTEICN